MVCVIVVVVGVVFAFGVVMVGVLVRGAPSRRGDLAVGVAGGGVFAVHDLADFEDGLGAIGLFRQF
jgi:hypothetical protein